MRLRAACLLGALIAGNAQTPPTQPSLEGIGPRVTKAITDNFAKYRNLLSVTRAWSEFTGQRRTLLIFEGPAPQVHKSTPVMWSHLQLVDGRAVSVLDGWEDERPLAYSFADIRKRMGTLQPDAVRTKETILAFLTGNHRLSMEATVADRGRSAYLLQATPNGAGGESAAKETRCASGMKAALYVDADTLFPLRVDAEVVLANRCQEKNTGATYQTGNQPGTRVEWHFARLRANDECGNPVQMWVEDQSTVSARIPAERMNYAGVAARTFQLGPDFVGGVITTIGVSGKFQVFTTCSRLVEPTDAQTERTSAAVEPKAELESYFSLDGYRPPRAPAARSAPGPATEPSARVEWDSMGSAHPSPAFGGPDAGGGAPASVNGIWKDPWTGLLWTQRDNGKGVTWEQARKYCQALRLGQYSDWRLATIDELQKVYDPRHPRTHFTKGTLLRQLLDTPRIEASPTGKSNINGKDVYRTAGDFLFSVPLSWSASLSRGNNGQGAWIFHFDDGSKDGVLVNAKDGRTLCVRP